MEYTSFWNRNCVCFQIKIHFKSVNMLKVNITTLAYQWNMMYKENKCPSSFLHKFPSCKSSSSALLYIHYFKSNTDLPHSLRSFPNISIHVINFTPQYVCLYQSSITCPLKKGEMDVRNQVKYSASTKFHYESASEGLHDIFITLNYNWICMKSWRASFTLGH